MALPIPSKAKLRDTCDYFVVTNPTPGTGLANQAAPTSFDETKYFGVVRNKDDVVTGKMIVPDYLKLICTAAGTGGASTHLTVALDNDASNTRYTSGGSALTPVATNGRVGSPSIADVHFGALVTVAGPGKRIVSNSIFRNVIPVVGDTYTLVFGDSNPGQNPTVNGTNPGDFVEVAPGIMVPPSWAAWHSASGFLRSRPPARGKSSSVTGSTPPNGPENRSAQERSRWRRVHLRCPLCLTADGEVVSQDDPRAVRLLVGVGGTIPASEAARYGLIAEPKKASPAPNPKTIANLESDKAKLASQLETANTTSRVLPASSNRRQVGGEGRQRRPRERREAA
jgi:hypothetical protein